MFKINLVFNLIVSFLYQDARSTALQGNPCWSGKRSRSRNRNNLTSGVGVVKIKSFVPVFLVTTSNYMFLFFVLNIPDAFIH